MVQGGRLKFGPSKYAALNLLIAKWLRHYAEPNQSYCYVTLGGTELYDVTNLSWMDGRLTQVVLSYEQDQKKVRLANATANHFRDKGVNVEIVPDDIFQYRRKFDMPHVFYLDLLGICSPDPYRREFKIWFENEVIQPKDLLLITSYLGRNVGWDKLLQPYDSEFRFLRISTLEEKKRIYHTSHPVFVLNRALADSGLGKELGVYCFGAIRYRDSSVMGLYGVICEEGTTDLNLTVAQAPYFDAISRDWTGAGRQPAA